MLHFAIDLLKINAFICEINNFDACFPFVSHMAMLRCTDLQRERSKKLKLKTKLTEGSKQMPRMGCLKVKYQWSLALRPERGWGTSPEGDQCLVSNREGLGTSLQIMGLATIDSHSQKEHTEIHKIPKFGVKQASFHWDTAI